MNRSLKPLTNINDGPLIDATRVLSREGGAAAEFVWDPDPASLSLETLKVFYAAWEKIPRHAKTGHALISGFDVLSFSSAMGYLLYLDVIDGGKDFRYRVYGSRIAQFSGFDLTGETLGTSHPPQASRNFMLESYRALLRHQHVLFTIHSPPKRFLIATWSRLLMPMSTDDGKLSRILVCNVPTLTRDGLMPVRSVYGDINFKNRPR